MLCSWRVLGERGSAPWGSGLWVRLAVVSNTAALSQLLPVVPSYVGWMQGQLLRIIYLFGGLEATSKPQKKLEIK